MDFIAFLILLGISVVVSGVLHFGLNYYVTPGPWSFASKVVVGYMGAWYGTLVFGRWWPGFNYQDIYYVPAVLGAVALILVAVDLFKMRAPGPRASATRRRR
jgi:uncharacterized membrane protein YeaQ/YmgE (transglycosylase-associated protein family)